MLTSCFHLCTCFTGPSMYVEYPDINVAKLVFIGLQPTDIGLYHCVVGTKKVTYRLELSSKFYAGTPAHVHFHTKDLNFKLRSHHKWVWSIFVISTATFIYMCICGEYPDVKGLIPHISLCNIPVGALQIHVSLCQVLTDLLFFSQSLLNFSWFLPSR